MASAHQVAAQILAGADEVAEALLGDSRDVDEAQLPRGEQTGEPPRVATVGLDPVGGRPRDQARGGDADVESCLGPARASPKPVGPAS
jgi:hypothetical protein